MNKSALEHRKEIVRSFHGVHYEGDNYVGEPCCDAARLIRSHAPEGRNYTNLEYVTMRDRAFQAEKRVEELERRVIDQTEVQLIRGLVYGEMLDVKKNAEHVSKEWIDFVERIYNRLMEMD